MTRVRVVVLNYDGGEDVQRALDGLARLEGDDAVEVVVIDNASTDGSPDAIAARHPEVRLVRNSTNIGFGANNEALTDLDGVDYVALLNNDAFVEPGWLAPLVDALDGDPGLGAAQSKILLAPRFVEITARSPASFRHLDPRAFGVQIRGLRDADGTDRWPRAHVGAGGHGPELDDGERVEWTEPIVTLRVPVEIGAPVPSQVQVLLAADTAKSVELGGGGDPVEATVGPTPSWVTVPLVGEPFDVLNSTGGFVADDGSAGDRGYLEADRGQYDEQLDLEAWSGGSVLLRPAYLAEVGLLDERFFLYYEDTDLSWRGRGQGWRYRYVPRSVVRHVHAGSSGDATRVLRWHVERNRLLFLTKNAPAGMAARAVLRHPLSTMSYARRDLLGARLDHRAPDPATVRLRASAYLSYLRWAPAMLADRRHRHR